MIKKRNLVYFLIFFFTISCSLDNKTGLWSGSEKEKKRMADLEYEQKQVLDVTKIYSSDDIFSKTITLNQPIILSEPIKNSSWVMSGLNYQNFLGNIYLSNIDNTFLKKKVGKNKFSLSKVMSSPLIYKNSIIFSDDKGTIFNVSQTGSINWKKNIYKKIYKKIYKNLTFSIYQDVIYIADNIGFIYAISFNSGELIWIKNHGIPIKSKIKTFKNRIYLINQDNRIFCLKTDDGSKVWDIRSINSFIKNQNLLSLSITENGDVLFINSSGDLIKANGTKGNISWSLNISGSMYEHATDFFKNSNIVIYKEDVIFSAGTSFFSYKLNSGQLNWTQKVTSVDTPIIDGKNIFTITDNGYLVIMNKETGEIISSSNILKLLKKKKRNTEVTGYVMGSGKLYAVTSNGFLIVSSASSGQPEYFKKIGDPIISTPIISNGSLYLLTENSKIFGLN